MTPTEDVNSSNKRSNENNTPKRRKRVKRKKKRSRLDRFKKILRTNPLKLIAPLFLVVLVVVSILFFMYDDGDKTLSDDMKLSKKLNNVYGLVIPKQSINEKKDILIILGSSTTLNRTIKILVSPEKLTEGFVISPMNFITCGNQVALEDSSKFTLSVEGDRLYITSNFRSIFTNDIIGSIEKKRWTFISKDISQFYSNDNLFEILDNEGYVMFSMQFIQPGTLSIRGYFAGERCIYIATEDKGLIAQPKVDNYLAKAFEEIRKIKRDYDK